MRAILSEFKQFLLKGDLISIAVAFVMATAFAALVKALISDLITPIIAAIVGEPNFGSLTFTIHRSEFMYGNFLNALITFVSIGAAVFFFIAKPYEAYQARRASTEPITKTCPECASKIPLAAKRCPQCTAVLVDS